MELSLYDFDVLGYPEIIKQFVYQWVIIDGLKKNKNERFDALNINSNE